MEGEHLPTSYKPAQLGQVLQKAVKASPVMCDRGKMEITEMGICFSFVPSNFIVSLEHIVFLYVAF